MIKVNLILLIELASIVGFSYLAYLGVQWKIDSWVWIVFTVAVMGSSYWAGYWARLVQESFRR